jgi:glutaredoxin
MCGEFPRIVTDKFKREIYDIAREIVRLEDAFIDLVYSQHHIEGLSATEVKQYIRFIADRRLVQLGLKENFMVDKNPLPWLDWIVSAPVHTNFFESPNTEYSVAGLQGEATYMKTRNFIIFSKDGCPYCTKAKELLVNQGHDFEEINLNDYNQRQEFYDNKGFQGSERTFPKIYENGELIGGFTELYQLLILQ